MLTRCNFCGQNNFQDYKLYVQILSAWEFAVCTLKCTYFDNKVNMLSNKQGQFHEKKEELKRCHLANDGK